MKLCFHNSYVGLENKSEIRLDSRAFNNVFKENSATKPSLWILRSSMSLICNSNCFFFVSGISVRNIQAFKVLQSVFIKVIQIFWVCFYFYIWFYPHMVLHFLLLNFDEHVHRTNMDILSYIAECAALSTKFSVTITITLWLHFSLALASFVRWY